MTKRQPAADAARSTKTGGRTAKAGNANPAPARNRLLRFLDSIGRTELIVFGLTIGVGIWSWLSYVVTPPQPDFVTFTIVFCAVNGVGALVQIAFLVYVRSRGSVRDRLTLKALPEFAGAATAVFWAPPLIFGVAFLALTPPSTPAAGFDPDMNIYQVIGITLLLCLIATALGALGVFAAIVVPIGWFLSALLPDRAGAPREPGELSRGEYLYAGLTVLSCVGFGIAMNAVAADAGTHFTRARMLDQLVMFVTLRGNVVATVLVVFFVAAIVAFAVLTNRATRRRERSGRDELERTAR